MTKGKAIYQPKGKIYFGVKKKICIFAAQRIFKRAVVLSIFLGIFYVHTSYGSSPRAFAVIAAQDCPFRILCSGLEGYRFFYCSHFYKFNSFLVMQRVKESSPKRNRPIHETDTSNATLPLQVSNPYSIVCFADLATEMQKHFDVEKNAKNKAYAFILSCGLLHRFAEFCRSDYSDDWHDTCSRQIELLVTCDN